MLFRKHIVSTRTLLQLTVATLFVVGGVGATFAATSAVAPLLVPYTINTIAGTPQFPSNTAILPAAGYFGENVPATTSLSNVPSASNPTTTFNGAYDLAVDSVGNVYITDTGNDIIREVNAQTGLITTIGGVVPKGCTGVSCTLRTTGCADGVFAAGNPIGVHIQGIAVDAYGNIYFDDNTTQTVSVIYRGGTQVANFIKLEDPAGVANSAGIVQVGYVYHVAGTYSASGCSGTKGAVDNVLASQGQLSGPEILSLDSAGNIYIGDTGNATTRVINTQATPQTFFQYTVPPGYIRSISDCNAALTIPCPTGTVTPQGTAPQLNTGINGPVNALTFNSQFKNATVDAYGNLYQLNGTGGGTGPPGIYSATTYAGGPALTNLLTVEAPMLSGYYGTTIGNAPNELSGPNGTSGLPTYGNSYVSASNPSLNSGGLPAGFPDVLAVTNENLVIRPTSLRPDIFGTFWLMDTHYSELSRIDQYTSLATEMIRGGTTGNSRNAVSIPPINPLPASFTNPYYCVYGNVGSNLPWKQGPQTYDPQGDGCPAIVAFQGGNTTSGPDVIADGLGNLFLPDDTNQIMREFPVGNAFPPAAVGTASPVTQPIQVHFTYPNVPVVDPTPIADGPSMTGYTTGAFSIAPGISDFTINTTTPEFPMGMLINGGDNAYSWTTLPANFQMWAGLPTCTQLGAAPTPTSPAVQDYDCLVYVTFNPTAPGVRRSQLVAATTSGTYYFSLTGIGLGGQLAIDGGQANPVAVSGLGKPAAVAVTSSGTVYIADPDNNRIVIEPAGGGTQTAITATAGLTPASLSGPKGVAVDATGNVYISDTGNNRIVKMDASSGAFTVLGKYAWISGSLCDGGSTTSPCPTTSGGLAAEPGASVSATTPPPQYAFNAPQGLAVDAFNNVYVADTGNSAVVEIPSNFQLGGATPLLSYPGAPKFSNPVAIAIDPQNNIWVADTNLRGSIVELPPGGGDLVNVPTSQFPHTKAAGLGSPNGIAVDAAGNVYVSDSGSNTVTEIPSGSGTVNPFAINFIGLSSPAGLALDSNGNLYVADSGNKQVLVDNRQSPMVNFGVVPQGYSVPPLCVNTNLSDGFNVGASGSGCVLTVTNIGSQPISLSEPLATLAGTGNPAFNSPMPDSCANVTRGGPLAAGVTCTISPMFTPTADNGQTETLNINGGPQSIALTANGAQPQVSIVLTSSLGTSPAAGGTTTITATVTQPHISGNTPSGTVTFTYVIDAANKNANSCGSGGTQTVTLAGGVASFQLPTLAQGVQYTISANYNGDSLNSQTPATPLLVAVPGIPVTVTVTSTAAQLTFLFGATPPTIAGTVTPTPSSPVTFAFGSAAKATTPIGSYPVVVSFSGAGACAYGFPPALFSNSSPAVVTENPAPLTYSIPNFTTPYGAPDLSFGAAPPATVTGAVNGDNVSSFTVSFSPAQSSVLAVGTYSVVPTLTGGDTGDYTITAKPATLVVTKAPVAVSISAAKTQVANTTAGVASATYAISVSTAVVQGKGTPSGTVTVSDVFTPITATGLGVAQAPQTATVTLVAGFGSIAPFAPAVSSAFPNGTTTSGMHQFTFTYNGDTNFQTATIALPITSAACTPSSPSTNCLVVDTPDFTLTSNTGPVQINPGTAPSGNGLLAAPNQSNTYPQTAVLFVNGLLSFAGQVNLFCTPQNPSYVSCFMTPASVTVAASGTGTTAAAVIGISTPAKEPLGFNFGTTTGQLRTAATRTMLAFLPFGALAFCVRRRRRLSKALWMLMLVCAVSAGMSGCGGNQVDFYAPIPTGPQTVTVTACTASTLSACQAANFTGQSRTFVVPININ